MAKGRNRVKSKTVADSSKAHEIIRLFIQTKVKGPECENTDNSLQLIQRAGKEGNIYQLKTDVYFCCYKTKIEEKDAVLLIFTIKLPGLANGSGSSEIVMRIVELLENILTPIDDFQFFRELKGVKQNYAILKAVKIIREDDII